MEGIIKNLIRLYMFYTRGKKKWQATFISFMQAICKQSSWYVVDIILSYISLTFPCSSRVKPGKTSKNPMKSTEPLPYFFCVSFLKSLECQFVTRPLLYILCLSLFVPNTWNWKWEWVSKVSVHISNRPNNINWFLLDAQMRCRIWIFFFHDTHQN